MASRARQSTAQPTPRRAGPATSAAGRGPASELPDHEIPQFPLNPAAQRALDNLLRAHDVKKLSEGLDITQTNIANTASEINERLRLKNERMEKVREKQQKRKNDLGADDTVDDSVKTLEESLTQLRDKVTSMTARMEESMRKVVDGKHSVDFMRRSVEAAAQNARNNASTQASTQNAHSQRSTRRQGERDDAEADEEDEELGDFTPTDPAGATQPGHAPIDVFKKHLQDAKAQYQSHSAAERYTEDNDYINFKRSLHDAQYPNDEVPLPPPSKWFNDDGTVAAPGVTARRTGDDDDSDEDMVVSRATVSTKCPLTLQELKEPYSSKKCQHTYEKAAILEFIDTSETRRARQPGRRAERVVQCPVSGCSMELSRADLEVDGLLVKKIRRLQKAKQRRDDGDEDEDEDDGSQRDSTQRRKSHIIDDDDEDVDADDLNEDTPRTQMKKETQTSAPPATSRTPRSTQVIDLESDDDEDESMER